MGLISKEEVLKRIEYHQSNKVINRIKTTYAFELLKSDIEEIEEIVTCGECIWKEECAITELWGDRGFCPSGERRTETLDERIKRGLKEWKEK